MYLSRLEKETWTWLLYAKELLVIQGHNLRGWTKTTNLDLGVRITMHIYVHTRSSGFLCFGADNISRSCSVRSAFKWYSVDVIFFLSSLVDLNQPWTNYITQLSTSPSTYMNIKAKIFPHRCRKSGPASSVKYRKKRYSSADAWQKFTPEIDVRKIIDIHLGPRICISNL